MAKLYATKYKYEISPNQELFAYGAGNILTAFFNGFPVCVALSRCAVLEGTGGKTQVRNPLCKNDHLLLGFYFDFLKACWTFGVYCCLNNYSCSWSIISYITKRLFSSNYSNSNEKYASANETVTCIMAHQ